MWKELGLFVALLLAIIITALITKSVVAGKTSSGGAIVNSKINREDQVTIDTLPTEIMQDYSLPLSPPVRLIDPVGIDTLIYDKVPRYTKMLERMNLIQNTLQEFRLKMEQSKITPEERSLVPRIELERSTLLKKISMAQSEMSAIAKIYHLDIYTNLTDLKSLRELITKFAFAAGNIMRILMSRYILLLKLRDLLNEQLSKFSNEDTVENNAAKYEYAKRMELTIRAIGIVFADMKSVIGWFGESPVIMTEEKDVIDAVKEIGELFK